MREAFCGCTKIAHIAFLLALALVFTQGGFAQSQSCRRAVPISAYYPQGDLELNVTVSNLDGMDGGKRLHLQSLSTKHLPPRVFVLLDTSGSMLGDPQWDFPLGLIKELVTALPMEVEIGLASFGDRIKESLELTNDRGRLLAQIDAWGSSHSAMRRTAGRTAIWDALRDSVPFFGTPRLGDAIYLVTDGGANAGEATPETVDHLLSETGIRLFVLLFSSNPQSAFSPPENWGITNLRMLATGTGGLASRVPMRAQHLVDDSGKFTDLGIVLNTQYRLLLNFYELNVEVPRVIKKPVQLKLNLKDLDKTKIARLQLVYPRKLLPCT